MRKPPQWEEMLPDEFFAEMARAPIAYWSCAAMEEHGLHMAIGNDYIQMYEVCLRAAQIAGGIVFPPVPFAPAYVPGLTREELRRREKELYPPSLWVSRELCERLYTELMESMADMGFKVCMALGGHYPADLLLRDIEKKHNGRIGDMLFYGGGTCEILKEEIEKLHREDPTTGGHGGMWESALVMAVRPDWADLSRSERVVNAPFASQLKKMKPENLARIKDATVEFGARLLNTAAEKTAARAKKLLAMAMK
ncbi:MAG: creatininase family protein [Planctomycetota bacterium]